jgi:dienelactone hydrolase
MPAIKTKMPTEIAIPVDSGKLKGILTIPEGARSIILFSHGSGSSRFSPRNKFVSDVFNKNGFATLVFDLLTSDEDKVYNTRFDIGLLIQRLLLVTDWVKQNGETAEMDLGYFGSSTGAASAFGAAAMLGEMVKAVVSRGGRPDLAGPYLPDVKAPSLFIIGGQDYYVIELNESAFSLLKAPGKISIVEDATHLFQEPGKLEEVARQATEWFKKYMKQPELSNL